MSREEAFPALLEEKKLQRIGVEVGVWRGEFADAILSRWPRGILVMVDPWRDQPTKDYPDPTIQGVNWLQVRAAARGVWEKHLPRVHMLRMKSRLAASTFEDGECDWVYLDAVHTYEAVSGDLVSWARKVRRGGVIGGHDYIAGFRPDIQVIPAVHNFFGTERVRVIEDAIPSWYVEL